MTKDYGSIVRNNLMNVPNYTPYCGAVECKLHWPRTSFDGEQFVCACGFRTEFPEDFMAEYKAKRPRTTKTLELKPLSEMKGDRALVARKMVYGMDYEMAFYIVTRYPNGTWKISAFGEKWPISTIGIELNELEGVFK